MIGYRDTTFCSARTCAKFGRCPRALTEAVEEAASFARLPIAQFSDPTQLHCFELKTSLGPPCRLGEVDLVDPQDDDVKSDDGFAGFPLEHSPSQ